MLKRKKNKFDKKILIIIIIVLLFYPTVVKASRGCCSHHGGISFCGYNGYYICSDGTQSPSCTCNTANNNDFNEGIELTDSSSKHSECENEVENLEDEIIIKNKKIAKLNEEILKLKNKSSNYSTLFWITLIIFIIYIFYKNKKDNTF